MALKDNEFLFLGKSEAINNKYDDVFMPVCAKEKIFIHNAEGHAPLKTTVNYSMPILQDTDLLNNIPTTPQTGETPEQELYMKALEAFMPTCILVNDKNEVRHLFGDCSNFIHMPPGRFTSDIFTLITLNLRPSQLLSRLPVNSKAPSPIPISR